MEISQVEVEGEPYTRVTLPPMEEADRSRLQDLLRWRGVVDVDESGNVTVDFAAPEFLDERLARLLVEGALRGEQRRGLISFDGYSLDSGILK
jgi:hypothetical protein